MAYLIITNGLDQGQLFELPEGKHILGRDEKAEIHVDLSAVSRKHASFEVSATRTVIRDLASSNGTLVNDSPVSDSIELIDGDTIQIADLVLQFFASAEPKAAKAQTQNLNQFQSTATVETLKARSDLMKLLRACFYDAGFHEVETPMLSADTVVDRYLHPISVDLASQNYWLQTSPEFAMKRLLSSGMDAIFQVCHAFRNEEAGQFHNLEFTMVEWYRTGDSTDQAMDFLGQLAMSMLGYDEFDKLSYQSAFQTILQIDPLSITEQELVEAIASLDFETPVDWRGLGKDDWLDLLLTEFVQPRLGLERPCILYNYPASQSALARLHPEDERVAERFELFVQGIELANGYHELLDAGELQKRNLKTNALRQLDDRPLLPSDSYLLSAMRHGLPDCCGVALGFDRLAMLALGKSSIDQVIPFPFDRA